MNASEHCAATVAAYFSMWNETDPARRRALVERVWTADAESMDPITHVRGWAAIDGFVASLQQAYPDHLVALDGTVDAHHDWARFRWRITTPAGAGFLQGIDCVQLGPDGRIARLIGFFDSALPPPDTPPLKGSA